MANNSTTQMLGIVAPVPVDTWDSSTTYYKLNIVRYSGSSYISKGTSIGIEPSVNADWEDYWQLLCSDGSGGGGGSTENAVLYTSQSLTTAQQAQARTNIGAASSSDVATLQTDVSAAATAATEAQTAASTAQETAESANSAATAAQTTADNAVSYATAQTLTSEQQTQALTNLGLTFATTADVDELFS